MSEQKFFETLEQETLVCARCGYCRVDCPTYNVTGWESSSPRARVKIAGDIINQGTVSAKEADRIFQCTFCGQCRETCSTDIDTLEMWRKIRERIAFKNKQPANLQKMSRSIQVHKNITGDEESVREIWLDTLDEEYKSLIGKKAAVLYFAGCTGSLFPAANKIPQSFVQILKKADVDFTLLGAQEECCGFPLVGCGEFAKGRDLITSNVDKIVELGVKKVLTTCPSCYRTIKDDWPQILGGRLPFAVMHASEFLEKLICAGQIEFTEFTQEVTYHDPCDLGRNAGIYEAPRNVIKSIPGVTLLELAKNRKNCDCCGGGGNLEAIEPDLVEQIALTKLRQVEKRGVKTVISSCQQCKRTLANAAKKNKIKLRVWDLTELVFRALKKE